MQTGEEDYHWVDQDRIPLEQLKAVRVVEDYDDKQELLHKKLEEL